MSCKMVRNSAPTSAPIIATKSKKSAEAFTFVNVAAAPPIRKPKKPPDSMKIKLLVKPPYDSKRTAKTSANVTIMITSLTTYSGKLETTLNMHNAVKDSIRASGLTRTSDFRSGTVASSRKTCILGLTRTINKDKNKKKKSDPVLPKNGTTRATNPKLARSVSLRASTMFTLPPFWFTLEVLYVCDG